MRMAHNLGRVWIWVKKSGMLSRKKRLPREKKGPSNRLHSGFSKDYLDLAEWSKNLIECEPGKVCDARLWRGWMGGR